MAEQPAQLNPTAASLLGFLHAGDFSGYELAGFADELIGDFWTLTRSQVYRELRKLAEEGLVDVGETGPRSRRPYRLNEAGRAAFGEWVARPPGTEQIRYPLLLTLSFGSWVGRARLLELVAEHRQIHEKRLARYLEMWAGLEVDGESAQDSVPSATRDPYQAATLSFGIHYERAVMSWMDELPKLLEHAE